MVGPDGLISFAGDDSKNPPLKTFMGQLTRCSFRPAFVVVEADATIRTQAVLTPGGRVGKGESRGGVPARQIEGKEMKCCKATIGGRSDP